ncbi:MAG: NAD(P)H-dependent oxidoreductase subunit E [Ignavibacteriaceae bacterium]
MEHDDLNEIFEKNNHKLGGLISALEEIQSKYSYLPEKALKEAAEKTGHSLVDVYGVASFYKSFSLKPRGKHLISVCLGTACHVRGANNIAREVQQQLGVKDGETTSDKVFTLEAVNCLGACALGPVVVVDGHYFPQVKASKVTDIIEKTHTGLDAVVIETDQRIFPVEVSCARCNHTLMDPEHQIDGHPSIRFTVSFDNKHGWFLLSCLYGSHNIATEYEIPPGTILNIFCTHCHAELIGGARCGECKAPMVPMIVRGGGVVQICARRGCKGHILDLGNSSVE